MPLNTLFGRRTRGTKSPGRIDTLNEHMLRDIGIRRIDASVDGAAHSPVPFTRYADL